MLPVLIEIGPLTIYSFGLVVFFGFLISSFLAFKRLKDENLEENDIFDLVLFAGFLGIVFSRLFYVIFHFERFGLDLTKILNFGKFVGFSFWGVVFGGVLAVWVFSKKRQFNFFAVVDNLVIPLIILAIFVQIGCFFNGCNLGKVTRAPWGVMMLGTLQRRHPIFLYEAGLLSILLIYFFRIEKRWRSFEWYKSKKEGFLFFLFLSLFSLIQAPLDFLKEDNLYLKNLRASFLVPLLLGIIFLIFLFLRSEKSFFGGLKTVPLRDKLRRGKAGREKELGKKLEILKEENENIFS